MTLRTEQSSAGTDETRPPSNPTSLHVYRIGGIWSDDTVVRADDRKTPRYYSKGIRLAGRWQFALHTGGPNGVVMCHVRSPYLGPPIAATGPGPISITVYSNSKQHIVEVKSSDGVYSFRGLDDKEYHWQPISWLLGNRMECRNSQDQVVATYRVTLFAISKDGELRIHQPGQFMTDLLIATCLAMRTPDH